jgi:peptidoglycan hydrolase-like protein with peptidoglycan-binding domain
MPVSAATVSRPTTAPSSSTSGTTGAAGATAEGARPTSHTVRRGENLTEIAQKYDVSIDQMMAANPRLKDEDAINAGQVLKVPAAAAAPAAGAVSGEVAPESTPSTGAASTATGPRPLAGNGGVVAAGPRAEASTLPTLVRGSRGSAVDDLQRRLQTQGLYNGKLDGNFGPATQAAVRQFQTQNGLSVDGKVGPQTWGALGSGPAAGGSTGAGAGVGSTGPADGAGSVTPGGGAAGGAAGGAGVGMNLPFTPNATALERARTSATGRQIATQTAVHNATYQEASRLTGVPAEMIAAIHVNESAQGTYRRSTHGPESGYGLDDRYVTTRWGNQQLARHGLGSWERGTNSEKSQLQSAVIAAEHLKRQARTAGIEVGPNMTTGEIAGAVTSYMAGGGAGRRANERGSSWMLNTTDNNPHPLHPGGTSRGPGGTTIRVAASRKAGLLRWDTLLPLLQQQMRSPGVS